MSWVYPGFESAAVAWPLKGQRYEWPTVPKVRPVVYVYSTSLDPIELGYSGVVTRHSTGEWRRTLITGAKSVAGCAAPQVVPASYTYL